MEDGALETVMKLGEQASLIQTLTLLRVKVVVFTWKTQEIFFSTVNSFTINSHGSM